jgi:hypothetical protein
MFPGGIEVDSQNRLYLCGSYAGLADFNPDPGVTNNLMSVGSGNFFVARYDQAGSYVWAIGFGGTGTTVASPQSCQRGKASHRAAEAKRGSSGDWHPQGESNPSSQVENLLS